MKQLLVTVNRKRPCFLPVFLFVLAFLLVGQSGEAQRLSYSSGQNISPGYEGWEEDPDGSRWFVFGYMNRNWEDEPDIPVGPENSISPGGPDLGQPTHFLPRGVNHPCIDVNHPFSDYGERINFCSQNIRA